MKFLPNRICPRVYLTKKDLVLIDIWAKATAKKSLEIRRSRGEIITPWRINQEYRNHDMGLRSEFAYFKYFEGSVNSAIINAKAFCAGHTSNPDAFLKGVVAIEIKGQPRKENLEKLSLPVKEKQFLSYKREFHEFAYFFTVERQPNNIVSLVGFARAEDIRANWKKRDWCDRILVHYCDLHPLEFYTLKKWRTSKLVRDVWDFC